MKYVVMSIVTTFAVIYAITAFITLEANPLKWTYDMRVDYIAMAGALSVVAVAAAGLYATMQKGV